MRSRSAKLCCLLAGAVLLAGLAAAQDPQAPGTAPAAQCPPNAPSPLAAAARDAKTQKSVHAKKVFTDDDVETNAGPLPALKMEGVENSDEVVAAVAKYKTTHTPEQTEEAVHMWYDRYDSMLIASIKENRDMATLSSTNMSNASELCQQSQDYQQCQSRQMADQRGMRTDQTQAMKNNALMMRVQRTFQRVRSGLEVNHLHYTWFRIQTNSFNGDEM